MENNEYSKDEDFMELLSSLLGTADTKASVYSNLQHDDKDPIIYGAKYTVTSGDLKYCLDIGYNAWGKSNIRGSVIAAIKLMRQYPGTCVEIKENMIPIVRG